MSRGLKNNNPGNIRLSATRYRGEVESDDRAFKRFATPAWGYRAMFVLLYTYQRRHGLNTLAEMIDRYAPPCENDTRAYVGFVARTAGMPPDEMLNTLSRSDMVRVVSAMSRIENGVDAVAEDVAEGWELFIKHKP
ncbi:structural protein P5 [Alistipes sp. OttesenSCG-928-B03]|nr:structural protein P5 [Alistipes sp. OttesenSCG-928-B03]